MRRTRLGAKVRVADVRDDREMIYGVRWQMISMETCRTEWFDFEDDRDRYVTGLEDRLGRRPDYMEKFSRVKAQDTFGVCSC